MANPRVAGLAKSLGSGEARSLRMSRIREPHVAALNSLVDQIREERRCGNAVPYFDPADGGSQATCLFVLEAPGPNAVQSGFISRDNPDESAKNFLVLNDAAGIPRALTLTANIVPWYIGSGKKIRAATSSDVTSGWPYLQKTLQLLPKLRVSVLLGRKAQRVMHLLREERPELAIICCPHPSPLYINRLPENRSVILHALQEAQLHLRTIPGTSQ